MKIGGGVNHRIGLFDMILLKDNHVDFAGGIDKAITRAKEYCKAKGKDLKIEIEVRNFDELQQVLDLGGVDRIMLDNFTPEIRRKPLKWWLDVMKRSHRAVLRLIRCATMQSVA